MVENNNLPVRKTMCATCPFKAGSKYAYLRADLEKSARTEATRICHSTGSNNAINRRTGFPPHICRGARDIQLDQFAAWGVIDAATDKAWNIARERIGMAPQIIQDPVKQK